jgi:hypothetical protein
MIFRAGNEAVSEELDREDVRRRYDRVSAAATVACEEVGANPA